jgi:hypothetical protein
MNTQNGRDPLNYELEVTTALIPVMDNNIRWSNVMTTLEKAPDHRVRIGSCVFKLEKDRLVETT